MMNHSIRILFLLLIIAAARSYGNVCDDSGILIKANNVKSNIFEGGRYGSQMTPAQFASKNVLHIIAYPHALRRWDTIEAEVTQAKRGRKPPMQVKERWLGILMSRLRANRLNSQGQEHERFVVSKWNRGLSEKDLEDVVARLSSPARDVQEWYN